MDHSAMEERDLESGGTGRKDELSSNTMPGKKPAKHMLGRLRSAFLGDGYVNGECSLSTYSKPGTSSQYSHDNVELLIDKYPEHSIERLPLLEKMHLKWKRKNSIRKASKPPRPPKGPTLDISDLKLVVEISELAMKRARIRRINAFKKMKAEIALSSSSSPLSASSFSGSLAAMVVTLLFFVAILFQGIFARHGSSAILQGSPEPATVRHSLISVRFFNSTPVSMGTTPSSIFPKAILKNVPDLEFRPQNKAGGASG